MLIILKSYILLFISVLTITPKDSSNSNPTKLNPKNLTQSKLSQATRQSVVAE